MQSRCSRVHGLGIGTLFAALAAVLMAVGWPSIAQALDEKAVMEAIQKTNIYIAISNATLRAVESWDRYRSWVNLKTGPTGKERYIDYGLYDVPEPDMLLAEAQEAANLAPMPAIDAAVRRQLQAYVALAPILNRASAYYDAQTYKTDNMVEGKSLHAKLMPLIETYLAEREAMLKVLRPHVLMVEGQQLALTESREGRSAAWHAGYVVHSANLVMDAFPRTRPEPISSEEMEAQMRALGPDTPGEVFDQLMSGVKPAPDAQVDMTRFAPALAAYGKAVAAIEGFTGAKTGELPEFIGTARRLLDGLQALEEPLSKSNGHEFEGASALLGPAITAYFELISSGSSIAPSSLRYLQ